MNSECALITGVSGQDGAYLAHFLLEKGYKVVGSTRNPENALTRLEALGISSEIELVSHPSASVEEWTALLVKIAPDELYNFAGQSSLSEAARNPHDTLISNVLCPGSMFEALRLLESDVRVFQAGSVQAFGDLADRVADPQSYAPANLYGATKLSAMLLAKIYRHDYGMFIVNGALAAHESKLRGAEFLSRKVTRTLAAVRLGQAKELYVGSLDARRDWGYAPDFVAAIHAALQCSVPRDYIIATGIVHTVRDLINLAATNLNFDLIWVGSGLQEKGVDRKSGKTIVRVDPAFFRTSEQPPPQFDTSIAQHHLGWAPKTDFACMIADMVAADLADLKKSMSSSSHVKDKSLGTSK